MSQAGLHHRMDSSAVSLATASVANATTTTAGDVAAAAGAGAGAGAGTDCHFHGSVSSASCSLSSSPSSIHADDAEVDATAAPPRLTDVVDEASARTVAAPAADVPSASTSTSPTTLVRRAAAPEVVPGRPMTCVLTFLAPLSPARAVGQAVLDSRGPLLLGLSVNNGYFSRINTITSAAYFTAAGHTVYPLTPHPPSVYTYRALGYTEVEGERKARQNGKRLTRCAKQGGAAVADADGAGRLVDLDWATDIESSPVFAAGLRRIREMYAGTDAPSVAFRNAVNSTTLAVVQRGKRDTSTLTDDEAVDIGKEYLLIEFAFVLVAHEVLGLSRDQPLALVYHREWPVFEDLVSGRFWADGTPIRNMGFVRAELEE